MADSDPNPPRSSPDFDAFDARLNARRAAQAKRGKNPGAALTGLGLAWRLAVGLAAAVLVGGLLGAGLDRWVGTTPWGLLVGLGFGFAAGIRDTMRLARSMQSGAGGANTGESGPDDRPR